MKAFIAGTSRLLTKEDGRPRSLPGESRGRPPDTPRGRSYITLPPLAVQSAAVAASVKPCPLQAFWPLQAFVALLQALLPLQELEPPHFTSAKAAEDANEVAA